MLPFEKEERKILVRKKAKSDEKFGCSPDKRKILDYLNYGVVNIDKPSGPTSHQVSAYVKQILCMKKCGHSGTLDPHVTGVLPVALENATKIVQVLLTAGKKYVGIMHLHKEISDGELENARKKFLGKITQLPPVKSSVKRALRERTVYEFSFLEREGKDVLFDVSCQAGTYIRKLVHDLGIKIGGAHMSELRRVQAGPFKEDTLVTLQDLKDAYYYYKEEGNEKYLRKIIQPVENAAVHIPKVYVLDSAVNSLCHGANLHVPGISKVDSGIKEGDVAAVMTLKGELICYGTAADSTEKMLGEKGLAVKVEKVFMLPGTYPKVSLE
ncbi:RNA-guided pseudouridylation complex pseudouridine synthase subunit Cbf5 [Candidatus Woesearchaeota archaeon]|nr:RNA-guided pseudouridylation complex pseudouridine synthase subunit Cbf5 [Candidatus Woesearchaeota archaeon]